MHPYQHHIDLCNRALAAVRPTIPANVYLDVHDYINRFDEWGLGMEILIDHLSDVDTKITREQFALIKEAMASIGLGECDRILYIRDNGVAA